jgi:DNA-binding response OmpR family regulator
MSSHSLVVLCVEDDVDTQEMMSVMLTVWGYEAQVAGTGAEALRVIRETRLAAVLLDNSLPDCSGIELCREVRRFDERLPIIFLSGSAHEEEREQALALGANAFVTKPFVMEALLDLLNAHAPV